MKHRLDAPLDHEAPEYDRNSDPYAEPIRGGVAVRVRMTRKRPRWDLLGIVTSSDPSDMVRAIDAIVDVSPFVVEFDLGPVLLSRREADEGEAAFGDPVVGGQWPGIVDDDHELALMAHESLPVVFGPERFWDVLSHLDGRPEFAGFGSGKNIDRQYIRPGMRLDAEGLAGLESALRTLEPAHVRAFHEGLAYYLWRADRPQYEGEPVPPRAVDLRQDPTVLQRIGLIVAGPREVDSVPLSMVTLSPAEEESARAILDLSGKVLEEGPSANWTTIYDPFTGGNPAWGDGGVEPDGDQFSGFWYDARPWGPFTVNASFSLFDGKTAYGLRLFVRTGSNYDELIFLVRARTRRRATEQVLSFLPHWIGDRDVNEVLAAEVYSSIWTFLLDGSVAFVRSLRNKGESADGFDGL